MRPTDLPSLISAGRPAFLPDGSVVVALSRPELDSDFYRSDLYIVPKNAVRAGLGDLTPLTDGHRDTEPVISPDGGTVVFRRSVDEAEPQLYAVATTGGPARQLTDHPLGANRAVFSPDGAHIAYTAAVPEPGRYGTADDDDIAPAADAESPRRIFTLSYQRDGEGYLWDKPSQVFLRSIRSDAAPTRLTAEPLGAAHPVFSADGTEVVYARPTAADQLWHEIVAVGVDPGAAQTRVLCRPAGNVQDLAVSADRVVFYSAAFTGYDHPGRTTGLWTVPLAGGEATRLTCEQTVEADTSCGPPQLRAETALITVEDRGSVSLLAVPLAGRDVPLTDLTPVISGQLAVKSFAVQAGSVVAVVAGPRSPAEVLAVGPDGGEPRQLTDLAAPLRDSGVAAQIEITGTAPDGYPVHGWLIVPPGQGPHPVLLNIHGGPHACYTWGLFDEAQIYAGAGYAVVMANPRGSSGYGQEHGRAIVDSAGGSIGTVDAQDVLALLDAALLRPDCDPARVGVMGGSYGGFMTSWLAGHTRGRFVAAISERAVNAWDSFIGSSDIGYYFARAYVGTDRDRQWDRSPLAYADQIDIPILIIHSEQDRRCPIEQGQRLFQALAGRGHETEFLIFPGEGHELSRTGKPRHRRQRFEAVLDWWDRYLPAGERR